MEGLEDDSLTDLDISGADTFDRMPDLTPLRRQRVEMPPQRVLPGSEFEAARNGLIQYLDKIAHKDSFNRD